jgi:DNA modification methylase
MKESKYNSIDLGDWKHQLTKNKITTNSRWLTNTSNHPSSGNFIIPNRDYLPQPSSEFHGIWISEIPYQMISRFTKEGDTVWSQFGGSGVDYEVAKYLNRECFINDINPGKDYITYGDSRTIEIQEPVDLILSHPPYWDMIKYSEEDEDGSSQETLLDFIKWWEEIVINSFKNLKVGGYFILACGNMYKNGEEIELGELLKTTLIFNGFKLKQHIIKDYGETKGSNAKNYNINYYRQLKNGYGNFYGDNIYVMKKEKSKNKLTEIYKHLIK